VYTMSLQTISSIPSQTGIPLKRVDLEKAASARQLGDKSEPKKD